MLKSKSHVINEAATTIVRLHPNKYDPFNHCEIIKVAFEVICKEVLEDDPASASEKIMTYVQDLFQTKKR
jgi:intein-encoded DNA endonuclease-like protein